MFDTEWGHEWPLWADDVEEPLLAPEDLGISAGLTDELRRFYDFWEAHDQPEQGWDAVSNQLLALLEAARLVELLAAELEGRYEVKNGFQNTRGCTRSHLLRALRSSQSGDFSLHSI